MRLLLYCHHEEGFSPTRDLLLLITSHGPPTTCSVIPTEDFSPSGGICGSPELPTDSPTLLAGNWQSATAPSPQGATIVAQGVSPGSSPHMKVRAGFNRRHRLASGHRLQPCRTAFVRVELTFRSASRPPISFLSRPHRLLKNSGSAPSLTAARRTESRPAGRPQDSPARSARFWRGVLGSLPQKREPA